MAEMEQMNPQVLALRRRRVELMQQRIQILNQFGLLHYRPHAKQDAFHKAGAMKRRMVRAGNRFGKSKMGCAEDCAWLMGERAWYPKGSVERTVGIPNRPVKGLVITTDFDKVDEVWTRQGASPGKLWQMLPNDFVKRSAKNQAGVIDTIECANGSMLKFDTVKSYQNNNQAMESSDWDFIHVDEPCPEKMWTAASRGLMDRHGSAWFTLTPLKEVWINDMFFPRDKRKILDKEILNGSKWAIHGSTYDNPYLSREAIEEFESTLTDEEKQCRINGLPLDLTGLIYKEFQYERHVLTDLPAGWTAWDKPPKNYTIYRAIDPHPQTPHAVLFCGVSPLGQKFFFHEIFEHCVISELAAKIHAASDGYYIARTKCDPLAYVNCPITGSNIATELENHGVYVEKATKDLSTGILKVKEALKRVNHLYFSPMLFTTLWEFERYVWDENNKPVDKDDHMMENLYRMILDDMRWVDIEKISNANVPVDDMQISGTNLKMDDLGFGD